MTSTIQDLLPVICVPLDKWSTREQLCLASVISCSGDQNWMSVSQTLKLVCGNDSPVRPADWFSQKNCAVQYGQLLENVETPKRSKLTGESASDASSPVTVETPTDIILQRLNDARIQELKAEIRKEQEEFAQIYKELKTLQSGTLNEEQLREMWDSIEKQQEQERIEEMKLENQLREREQHMVEMHRNWRTLTPVSTEPITTDTTSVDMDLEDIVGDSSSEHESIIATSNHLLQKTTTNQTGTSPLLTSLLKTTSTGTSATTAPSANSSAGLGNSSARSSAPTITTLLTCGSIPNKNQPAITLKANIPPQKAAQLLSSPISGPPTITSIPVTNITAQNLLSPSQAAPTLSMLLEKNKVSATPTQNSECRNDSLPQKVYVAKQSQLEGIPNIISDDNKEEIPMDLDEDIVSHIENSNVNILGANDSDEPDPNEEQQLLEVFKNIGNIDELDIDVSAVIDDEEVDFLKDMGADSPSEVMNMANFEREESTDVVPAENFKENGMNENASNLEDSRKASTDVALPSVLEKNKAIVNSGDNKPRKPETISSDDSNDNIPLAAVASLEQRAAQEKEICQENNDSAVKNDDIEDISESSNNRQDQTTKTLLDSFEEDNREHDKLEQQLADLVGASDIDETKNLDEEFKSPASESSDIIIIPTDDDDSCGDKAGQRSDKLTVDADAAKIKKDLESDIGTIEVTKSAAEYDIISEQVGNAVVGTGQDAIVPLPTTISIADTDEDSSTTDISIVTRKDDKSASSSVKPIAPLARKSLLEAVRHDQQNKTDDESTTQFSSSSSSSVTPARPPLLRKLRDRDRSESPMIEGDSHMASNNATSIENLTSQRLRRRYSSTPINDSIPNSPASSDRDRDDLDTRVPKKSLLSIFHALQYSKNASTLQRAFHENVKFDEVCLRPMDMLAIRKQIEAGTIRNVNELQRDIMLMCQNGLMLFKSNTTGFNAANAFMQECQAIREFVANSYGTEQSIPAKDNKDVSKSQNISGTSSKSRSGSRKSQRIS